MSDSDSFRHMIDKHYEFFKKGAFIDVSFKVGGTTIGAHKTVLASCSKVFCAMFETEMKESQTEEVEISDVDEEAFKVFLEYIYSRDHENIEEHLAKLFMLADKYDIPPLVDSCEQFMKNSLKMDNAFDYLEIADLYRRDETKKCIIDFIKQNLDTAIHSDKWEELKAENPTLISTVFLSLINDRSGPSRKINSYVDINHKFCDAVVKIGSDEFPIHKFILAEKSGQFLRLFENDPKECHVDDVSAPEFKTLMDYVYMDVLPNDDFVNEGILKAAHKFALHELVDHCVSRIKRDIHLENAVPTLITAKTLQLVSLKSSAMEFIVNNLDAVKEEENWKDLTKYPNLLLEIYMKTQA